LRDVAVRKVFHLAQDKNLTEFRWQACDDLIQIPTLLRANSRKFGIGRFVHEGGIVIRRILLRQRHMHLLPCLSDRRKKAIANNRKQPRLRVASPKPIEAPVGAQYRFLNDVVSRLRRTREPTRQIVGGVEVRQDLRLESTALVIHASERS
jgi:hypothetical protein